MKNRKVFILILALILLISMAACGTNSSGPSGGQTGTTQITQQTSAPQETEAPIKMTAAFGDGFPDGRDGPFDDPAAKEIMKITGVEIENIPLGESSDAMNAKLNIMLASGDYPEMLSFPTGDIIQKYIKEGAIIPIDDLVSQYGPNIQQSYGVALNKLKDPATGKLYALTSWHGYTDPSKVGGCFGINIKHDILKQIAPEIADSNAFITPEKFYELLKLFKGQFPTIGDKASIPFTFSVDQKFYDGGLGMLGIMKAAYGIKRYSEDADHNLKIDLKDPRYPEVLKFLSKLQREKLIDPEWTTLKYSVYGTKLAQGNVFASTGAWFETMAANTEFAKKDPGSQYYAYVIAADGVTNPPLFENKDTGNSYIAITKNCKDPVRAVKFLDFLSSPEGNFLMYWGPQGTLWDVNDGKRQIKPEYVNEYTADVNAFWKKYKIRIWALVNVNESELANYTYPDGSKYVGPDTVDNPFMRYYNFACKSQANTSYDPWVYQNIEPLAGSDEATISQKFADIKEMELFKIIIEAKNDEDVQARLDQLIQKANGLGIEKVEAFVTAKYKERLSMLNK